VNGLRGHLISFEDLMIHMSTPIQMLELELLLNQKQSEKHQSTHMGVMEKSSPYLVEFGCCSQQSVVSPFRAERNIVYEFVRSNPNITE
jgi:adenylylsulfate kinase-like enzyme